MQRTSPSKHRHTSQVQPQSHYPQLDESLEKLAPSEYDMIVRSLPHQSRPQSPLAHARDLSDAEKLASIPGPAAAKSAWQRAHQGSSDPQRRAVSPSSLKAQGKQPQRNPAQLGPGESFVLLQDSVIRNIPPQTQIQSHVPTKSGSGVSKVSSTRASTKSQAQPFPTPPPEPQAPETQPTPISHHLRSTIRLFNLLSTRTDIDHPLCAECTQILLSSLQRNLDELKKERDGYLAYEKEVRKAQEKSSEKDGGEAARKEEERKIERLIAEERTAVEGLKEAEREREKLDEELRMLEEEEKALREEEAE